MNESSMDADSRRGAAAATSACKLMEDRGLGKQPLALAASGGTVGSPEQIGQPQAIERVREAVPTIAEARTGKRFRKLYGCGGVLGFNAAREPLPWRERAA